MSAHLKAKMSLDSTGVKAGTAGATKEVNAFSSQLKKIGPQLAAAFSVGAIAGFTKKVIEYGSQISDLAYQTGLSIEELQGFQVAVTNAGGSVEGAAKGLLGLRDAQDAALNGEALYSKAFERLGVTMDDLVSMTMPQLLEAVAKNYSEMQDFGALVDLFGKRNAGKLEEALIALADNGFGGLIDGAKEAGLVMSEEDVLKLDATADKMEQLGIRMKTFWGGVLGYVMDFGAQVSRGIVTLFSGVEKAARIVSENVKNILKGNFKTVKWNPAEIIGDSFKYSKRIWDAGGEAITEEKEGRTKRIEEQSARRKEQQRNERKGKIGALYSEAADAGNIEELIELGLTLEEALAHVSQSVKGGLERSLNELKKTDNDAAAKFKDQFDALNKKLSEVDTEEGAQAIVDAMKSLAKKVNDSVRAAAKEIGETGSEIEPKDKKTPQLSARRKRPDKVVYSGGMGKSLDAAKGFYKISIGDLEKQLEYWNQRVAASRRGWPDTTAALGWNAAVHTQQSREREEFNRAATTDVIKRITMLIEKQSLPQKELSFIEKESKQQTNLLRNIRSNLQFANELGL